MDKRKYVFTKEHRKKLSEAHKGKKQSLITIKKRSESLKGKKRPPFSKKWRMKIGLASKGRKHTEKTRRKLSEMQKGNKSNSWKGGISRKYKEEYWSLKYRLWRESVFQRDIYQCQKCGFKGNQGYLTAHHIKSWAKYPELRFDINNGITLCEECHKLTDNYKGRGRK
jgi:5-methylcytosine-specific restriction endonuclease McrA